jgi:HEPN domain-containing protein
MAACEEARRLLAKAAEDEYVLDRLLNDAAAPEAMVGFHAQQAAEKMLKATLFLAGAAPPRTHNLSQLLDLAVEHGLALPAGCDTLDGLTPYAVLFRYEGDADADEERLDRPEVRQHLRRLRAWVEARLEAEKKQPPTPPPTAARSP